MKREYVPPTERGTQRKQWFDLHKKPGMSRDELCELVAQAAALYPASLEERQLKWESLKGVPEFVL